MSVQSLQSSGRRTADHLQSCMKEDDCGPGNAKTLSLLYGLAGRGGDWPTAQKLQRMFEKHGVLPDEAFAATQIDVYRCGDHFVVSCILGAERVGRAQGH